jgi:hypothetical protein
MKRYLILAFLTASAFAQVASPPAQYSRTGGRFIAWNYGQWRIPIYQIAAGTGSQTFSVTYSQVKLPDGRAFMPFSTNAPIYVGKEVVTPTVIGSGCLNGVVSPGTCKITATFSQSHSNAEPVASATFGLQEALNDGGASGGGTITVDSAWTALGGTSGIVNAAILPANTGIEDERTGPVSGSGPGGSNTNVQYNNSGSFGANSNFTTDGSGNLTYTTGTVAGALTIPAVNVNTVQNQFLTTETLSGSSPLGDVTNLFGDCYVIGTSSPGGDAHCVGIKGLNEFNGTGTSPKNIGLEGAVTNDGAGTIGNGFAVQGIFGGNNGSGTFTSFSNFEADSTGTNTGSALGRYIDFHASSITPFCANSVTANECFAFLNEDPTKIMVTYGKMAVGNVTPAALLHVYAGSSGQTYLPGILGAGVAIENAGSNCANSLFETMTLNSIGVSITNCGYMAIREAAAATLPLMIGGTGELVSLGDTDAVTTQFWGGNRGYCGWDSNSENVMCGGISGKGFEVNVNNSTPGSGRALVIDTTESLGLGTSNTAASDLFNVTPTGLASDVANQSIGTTFTTTGCSVSATTGGATAGKMTIGANTCTILITLAGATGVTAKHGWSCGANDETTAAGNTQLYFTAANSATQVTLSVPATAGTTDVIDFRCTAY